MTTQTGSCSSKDSEYTPFVFQIMDRSQKVLAAYSQLQNIAEFSFHTVGGSKILRDMCKERAPNSRATEWKTNKMSIFKLS